MSIAKFQLVKCDQLGVKNSRKLVLKKSDYRFFFLSFPVCYYIRYSLPNETSPFTKHLQYANERTCHVRSVILELITNIVLYYFTRLCFAIKTVILKSKDTHNKFRTNEGKRLSIDIRHVISI